jgi:putative flippase GtrA
VFANGSGRGARSLFLPFFVVGALGLLLNQLIIYTGVDILSLHVLVAKALSAAVVFWFNFYLRGTHVFKDPDLI